MNEHMDEQSLFLTPSGLFYLTQHIDINNLTWVNSEKLQYPEGSSSLSQSQNFQRGFPDEYYVNDQ